MSQGVKHDGKKPVFSVALTLFPDAISGASASALYGLSKYPSLDNWRRVQGLRQRYFDAMVRHYLAAMRGETHDQESGLSHWAHFAWNALALAQIGLEQDRDEDL